MRHYTKRNFEEIQKISNFNAKGVDKELVNIFFFDVDEYKDKERCPIIIEGMGITYPDPKYEIKRYGRPNFILELILEGEGYAEINGEYKKLKTGDVVFSPPNSSQHYGSDKKNPYKKIWVNFRSLVIEELVKSLNFGDSYFFNVDISKEFEAIFSLENKTNISREIAYDLLPIIVNLVTKLKRSTMDVPNKNQIPRIISYLKDSIDFFGNEFVSILHYAKQNNVTEQTIISGFKKFYGVTPHQYMISSKMKKASHYLKNTPLKISEIANILSFADAYSFSHTFKKYYGVSPDEYRKTQD